MSDMESLGRGVHGFPHDKIIYDQEGNPLKVGVVDGRTVPPFGQKSVKKVRDLSIRDDDILLVGYPKTGCHWTYEILNMIVSGKAGYSEIGKSVTFLEFATTEMIESYPGRRVLNTHLWFDYLPKQITEKKTKMVLTVRNPKDTAVSYYNHHKMLSFIYEYKGTFKGWFPLYLDGQLDYGSYFDYYQRQDQEIKDNADQPILVVSYEDMKEDLPREIRKMSKFIDVSLTDQQVEEIAKAAGFDSMKAAYEKSQNIANILIRKGEVGEWKTWLTVAQSEIIDAKVEEKLKGTIFSSPRYVL